MVANGQLNMFDSDTPARRLPLPEHLNYGVQERGMHPIPGICGLYYLCGFLDDHAQHALIECVDAQPWRTDLDRRVQHYGWRYDYRTRTVTSDMDLGPLPDWVADIASRLYSETKLFDQVRTKRSSMNTARGRESRCMRTGSVSEIPWPPYRWATTGKCDCDP